MSRSGWLFPATASIVAWVLVTSAGCSLLTGLDRLNATTCVGACDAGDATVDDIQDSPQTPSDGTVVDSAPGNAPTDAALDSSPEGSGPSEGGMQGATGADARPDGSGRKCGSNLLAPITAAASTVTSPNVAAYAIDGMLSTRWESAEADPQWLDVDFGAPVFIGEVDVLWEAACAASYDLEVSMDGTTWTTIPNGTITGNTLAANPPADTPIPPTDWTNAVATKPLAAVGRYLRIDGTIRCTPYGYSIWEMRAYGDGDANCVP